MKIMNVLRINDKRLVRGTLLLEIAAGFGALLLVSLLLLKAAITVTTVQKWTVEQGLTDAYMSQEVARAKRYPFTEFLAVGSPWPVYPTVTATDVIVGRLPGGKDVVATLRRTRVASTTNNLPAVKEEGVDTDTNPTRIQIWQLQSYLTYQISGRDYVKSRTVIRAR